MHKANWAILLLGLIVVQLSPIKLRAGQDPPGSTPNPVAQVRERINVDRLEIHVYQGRKPVRLPAFMELLVVTPVAQPPQALENLTNRSVAIIPSDKNPDRSEVYQDVFSSADGRVLTLAGNVFKVKQVLISSSESQLELRLDEKVVKIQPGDALLVL